MEIYKMYEPISYDNLRIGQKVIDLDSNKGQVAGIEDINNIIVLFDNLVGVGVYSLNRKRKEYDPLLIEIN